MGTDRGKCLAGQHNKMNLARITTKTLYFETGALNIGCFPGEVGGR